VLEATSYLSDIRILHPSGQIASGIRKNLPRELPATELPLIAAGDDLARPAQFLTPSRGFCSAADGLQQLP